ncbi:MAG: aminodeoxychorismate/anthranilate synthase component II [Zymomonas mobilis subsp. pomaceae]|uniref:Glutamine amidotransferase of anthranilate synthase n=1 Tax=Zymomonas mobilis subsp. pomaceae (strain ATCC 29192 / DSM 22645 / JCM 10191 / CCUG 17912 / NBRC 13757 / NCIMB 11200 / NRRL B-4491 / Barker I) TaxID=579138 RepID=F8ESW4_ZYMMT|nr:aminodeoxychorismate/anthranilate synthase component II [Zymomonas mobilis]AEI37868.1 glutamine amidotransferase of anthranilate synthase [Zymomonas mobilis subsp. pomaceae ATCC 29192]MDX5949235.1 aminodeoxychorismate/anthranilate synthase component II [Zymomonas mobilis subsp. pomaceae]GEB89536.1 aminodeoxychorismate/anthranilate synthase component II [Zymomonas mobilis subsp. pomaceae]
MILVIDNYDSFTWNIVHYLQELGADIKVVRNDALTVSEAIASGAEAFVISPGPKTPDEAGISLKLVEACVEQSYPLLGICLGHQTIGQYFGGKVIGAHDLMHGKTSPITHDNSGVFESLPSPLIATRYHSLVVEEESFPADLIINSRSDDGTIMGLRHKTLPLHGLQFHPESIATEHGHKMLGNFLKIIDSHSK